MYENRGPLVVEAASMILTCLGPTREDQIMWQFHLSMGSREKNNVFPFSFMCDDVFYFDIINALIYSMLIDKHNLKI